MQSPARLVTALPDQRDWSRDGRLRARLRRSGKRGFLPARVSVSHIPLATSSRANPLRGAGRNPVGCAAKQGGRPAAKLAELGDRGDGGRRRGRRRRGRDQGGFSKSSTSATSTCL